MPYYRQWNEQRDGWIARQMDKWTDIGSSIDVITGIYLFLFDKGRMVKMTIRKFRELYEN